MPGSVSDLRRKFYGGSSDAELQFLLDAEAQGVTAGQLLTGRGVELGYAESLVDTVTPAGGAETAIAACVLAVTVKSRPIKIEFGGDCYHDTIGSRVNLRLKEGATALKEIGETVRGVNDIVGLSGFIRLAPAAGSHTYQLYVAGTGGGIAHALGFAGGPLSILVTEV